MSIITISRCSSSQGKTIAEKLAAKMNYECVAREIIVEAHKEYGVSEKKLVKALHDSPSFFEKLTYGKEKYITLIRNAFFHHIVRDNIVYHGLAGQFFLKDIPNVLKVRIIANMEDRIVEEMKRENCSERQALKRIKKDDSERKAWGNYLYNIDTADPTLYDTVIHLDQLSIDDAVETIFRMSALPNFKSSVDTIEKIRDLYISSKVQAILMNEDPTLQVRCHDGHIQICCVGVLNKQNKMRQQIYQSLKSEVEIRSINFEVIPVLETA